MAFIFSSFVFFLKSCSFALFLKPLGNFYSKATSKYKYCHSANISDANGYSVNLVKTYC